MKDQIKKYISEINQAVDQLAFGTSPANLYDPIDYIMALGGKRIRPLLAILAYLLYRDDYKRILKPALSVELFHNFTLMHDDLMDKAPLRRGKSTVHQKWNDNIAILSGDVMLVRVYDLLLEVEQKYQKSVISGFNNCAAEVCEGQQYDMDFEQRTSVAEQEYIQMIKLKTAVLLGYSLELGGRLAGAADEDLSHLRAFGINIGIAFQLMDDLLDVYADTDKFGKQIGGDIIANKKTYLLIKAFELARGTTYQEILVKWVSAEKFDESEKVKAVKAVYDALKIKEITEEKMHDFFKKGVLELNEVKVTEERKVLLSELVNFLMQRES